MGINASEPSGPTPFQTRPATAPASLPAASAPEAQLRSLIETVKQLDKRQFEGSAATTQKELKDLKEQIGKLEGVQLPEEMRGQLHRAKQIVQSALTLNCLSSESKATLNKVKTTLDSIKTVISSMEGTTDPEALKRERGRRLMHPIGMLLYLRNQILSEDPERVKKSPELKAALKEIDQLLDRIVPADREQVRALHGLHLEGNTPVGFENITDSRVVAFKLNFAEKKEEPPSSLAERRIQDLAEKIEEPSNRFTDAYKRSIQPTYSHHHFIPLESTAINSSQVTLTLCGIPQAGTIMSAVNYGTSEEVVQKIESRVRQFISTTDYNSFHTLIGFIEFYEKLREKDPKITPLKAYQQYDPDDHLVREHGDSCVGQTAAILEILKKEHGIEGHAVIEREGPMGMPKHAAAVIPCRDGIILLEILYPSNPLVIVKPNQLAKIREGDAEQTFAIESAPDGRSSLHKTSRTPLEDGKLRIQKTEFPLAALPTKPVMLKYMVDRVEFPLVKDGCPFGIIVNVHEGEVVFKIGEGKEAKRTTIPFSRFSSPEAEGLLDQFSKELNLPKEVVEAQIGKIIKNQKILEELQAQARVPVPTYEKGSKA